MATHSGNDYLLKMLKDRSGDPEFDPLWEMAKIARDESVSVNTRAKMWANIVNYIHPKLSSSEVSTNVSAEIELGNRAIANIAMILSNNNKKDS